MTYFHISVTLKRQVFPCWGSLNNAYYEPRHEKTCFLHICENKEADQLCGNRATDQHLCFRYMSFFFLNQKFQASSHHLWQYSLVCVGPGLKLRRQVLSRQGSCPYVCSVFSPGSSPPNTPKRGKGGKMNKSLSERKDGDDSPLPGINERLGKLSFLTD